MNPKVKSLLIIAAKNAVNALLVTITPIFQNPASYQLNTLSGWGHIGELVGAAVLTREALVWGPKILAWSQSNGDGVGGGGNGGGK